jgi:hypothetical protein
VKAGQAVFTPAHLRDDLTISLFFKKKYHACQASDVLSAKLPHVAAPSGQLADSSRDILRDVVRARAQ